MKSIKNRVVRDASEGIRWSWLKLLSICLDIIPVRIFHSDRQFGFGLLILQIITVVTILISPAVAAVNIVCTSGNQFYIDSNVGLDGRYVSYQITNTGPQVYADIWVEIGSFTGGVVNLAPNGTNLYNIDSLQVGETKTAFFYITAGSTTAIPQSHTISVYEGEPPSGTLITSATFTIPTIGSSISAASNKITTIIAGPTPPELGGVVTITVDGDCGVIGRNGVMIFSPAGFTDWPADAYKLVSTEVILSGGINATLRNTLFYSATGNRNATYHAVYTFRAVGVTEGPTVASPVATISSGNRMKHDNVNSYNLINPILPATSLVTIGKSVNPPNITGGDTATYTISILNSGNFEATLDSLIDMLPSSPAVPSYLNGSSLFNSVGHTDPLLIDSQLKWVGPFTVAAGATAALTFDIIFPSLEGAYQNLALGKIGNTLIDTTLNLSDYAPASATIIVGMPDIVMLKSAQIVSDPINGNINPKAIPGARLIYSVIITNQGIGMADDHSVFAGEPIPSGTAFVASDIAGVGSGPILFEDGTPASGLSYIFGGLNNLSDNLAFSNDNGLTFDYIPQPDSTGIDPNITNITVNPSGPFQGASGGNYPSFRIRFMVQVR